MTERHIALTLESHLASFQDEAPEYHRLYDTWQIAKADLSQILQDIMLVFPHYSRHDESHSKTIIRRVEAVLGEKRIAKLQPTETWLILMSAYTHDLGMLVSHEELCRAWESPEFAEYLDDIISNPATEDLGKHVKFLKEKLTQTELPHDWPVQLKWSAIILSADYFRNRHSERSKEIIRNGGQDNRYLGIDFSFNKFIPKRLIDLLGEIALLHGQSFNQIFDLKKRASGIGLADDIIYPRRVAALLRLGDLLDMDNGRFDENAYSLYGDVPNSTLYHQEKHASLTHFLVTENRIEASADCPTEGSFDVTSRWLKWLEDELRNLSLRWNDIMPTDFGTAPTLINPEIKLKGKFLKGNSLRQFNFNNETIFELLEGANIYRDRFSCFRELVQNAIDASKMRLWHQIQSGEFDEEMGFREKSEESETAYSNLRPLDIPISAYKRFTIDITIQYDHERNGYSVSVVDHGIGISEERLDQMEQVAQSWYAKKDPKSSVKEMPIWLRPTGEFGLGLQSVFQVTDELRCITNPENESSKEIIFRSKANGGRISCQEMNTDCPWKTGSSFTFFIPYGIIPLTWSFGDQVDKEINMTDPFLTEETEIEPYLKLISIVNRIRKDVVNNIFSVNITTRINDKSSLYRCEPAAHHELEGAVEIDRGILATFDLSTGRLLAYDPEYAIFFDLMLAVEYSLFREIIFLFKGMSVEFPYWRHMPFLREKFCRGTIEFNGFSAREYLTLNREKFRYEKCEEIFRLLEDDLYLLTIYCYKRLKESGADEIEKIPPNVWHSFAGLYTILSEEQPNLMKDCKEKILNKVNARISVYQICKDGDTYQKKDIPLRDCLEPIWNGRSFFVFETHHMEISVSDSFFVDAILKISEHCADKPDVIFQKRIIEHFVYLKKFDLLSVYGDSRFAQCYIYEYRCKNDGTILPKLQGDAMREFRKRILQYPRMALMACTISEDKTYNKLLVKDVPNLIWWSHYRYFRWTHEIANRYYMITPFTAQDIERINTGSPSDEVWSQIEQREDFKKLVEYIKRNNINDNLSEDEIRHAYKQWITDIINIKTEVN